MLIHDLNERKWKTLKSEYLIRRPWLTARRDTVELPGGSVNPEFYVLEYPDWVNVLAITSDDEFVMIRSIDTDLVRHVMNYAPELLIQVNLHWKRRSVNCQRKPAMVAAFGKRQW